MAVRRAPVLIGVAALLAAGLGFLAGRATTPHAVRRGPAAARQVSIGLATLSVPRAWHRRAAPPGLSPAVAVSPARAGGRELVVGSAATSAPTFLPTTLLGAGATPPSRQIVQLGSLQLYRYVLSGEIAYALPTTAGTIVAECLGAFDASCHGVLASLRISSGSALPLTPSAAYASELDGIVLPLRALHSSLGPVARSAPLNRAAAGAAARLTAAYTVAAGRIRALDAGVAAAANAALAGALTQTADAYRALARALARTGRGPESDAALAALAQANGVAAAAYSELAYFGYRVP